MVGPQYRSVVFYHNNEQKEKAEKYKAELERKRRIQQSHRNGNFALETSFYVAENYHQDYFNQNGGQPYCNLVIRPKVEKFQKVFKSKLKH